MQLYWILKNLHNFIFLQSYARNLEQPEVKDWLANTKDMLMGEKSGEKKEEAAKALNAILERFDNMALKVNDTKQIVDCLWKCYQVSIFY